MIRLIHLLLWAALLALSGCIYVSHPVIYYKHRETEVLMKPYLAGERLPLDQPTLQPFYLNGVLVQSSLWYAGQEGRAPESGYLYGLSFTASSYAADTKFELKRLEIPGLPEPALPPSGIIELGLIKPMASAPYHQKHRDHGLYQTTHNVTKSIKEAGLDAAIAQNKKVEVVALVAVTNNGRTEEREITYVMAGRSYGHLQPID